MSDLVAALANRVRRYPDQVALTRGDQHITLAQLWRQVCGCARMLRDRGLENGDRVALIGSNSPDWVVVYLGAMAAGGVAVPLNPELRSFDLAVQVEHSGARLVFVDLGAGAAESFLMAAPHLTWITRKRGFAANALCLEDLPIQKLWQPQSTTTDIGCILYTSGTTGTPKGVMLSRSGLLQNAEDVAAYLSLGTEDNSLALLPFYYSFGNSVLLTHLLSGARLVFGASLMYPESVLALVERERITGLAGVPTLFQVLLSRNLLGDPRWHSLRYVAQAGGPLPPAVVAELQRQLPNVEIYLMYGQTEATARICYLPPQYLESKPGSVGWPLPDICIQIRNEDGHRLPAGEVGQVWIRGPSVMLGYWKNARATAEMLVDGWLNTGDMGVLDEEGFLYLRGRRSDLIKVAGQRLHPQELESVICELPQVAECAVDAVEDPMQGQVPRVFVVLKPGQYLDRQQVLHHCRSQLASWKIPRFVEVIEALPKTGSGKVQRYRLQELVMAREGRA